MAILPAARITRLVTLPPTEPLGPPSEEEISSSPTPVPAPLKNVNGVFQRIPQEQPPLTPYQEYVKRVEAISKGKASIDLTAGEEVFTKGLRLYQERVIEPLAARATVGVQKLIPGEQEIESKVGKLGFTEAYRQATLPRFVKGAIELIVDPINLVPGVGFTGSKALRATLGLQTAGDLGRGGLRQSGAHLAGRITTTEDGADAAARAGEVVTLWRGEPIGVRPLGGKVPFTLNKEVAQGWAGRKGRVVSVNLSSAEVAQQEAFTLPGRGPTYLLPQDIYARAQVFKFTVDDIHALADAKGILWDDNPAFMEFTKSLTGKSKLDDLSQDELALVQNTLAQAKPGILPDARDKTLIGILKGGIADFLGQAKLPEIDDPAVMRLTELIRGAKPIRATQEALKTAELGERAATASSITGRGAAEGAFTRGTAALKGELPKARFEAPQVGLEPAQVEHLFEINRTQWLSSEYFTGLNTEVALTKVLTGQLPTQGEIVLLENTFGRQLAEAILSKRPFGTRALDAFLSVANAPRALVASADLSAPLRQGIMLGPGHPREFFGGFVPMVKAFGSESFAKATDEALRARSRFALADKAGLYIAPLTSRAAALTISEEAYMSRLVERLPWVRSSQRAYVTYLNKFRADVFDTLVAGWERTGTPITEENVRSLADFINKASGRGSLGKSNLGPAANAVFFAPRLVLSRFQAPTKLLTATSEVRKTVAKDMVAFFGGGSLGLIMLRMSGAVDVEHNPLSSDFGRLRIGPTRIDFWGGEQPLARFIAQMLAGTRKSLSTGEIHDISRPDTAERFFRSKLAPVPSLIYDYYKGNNFFGGEISAEEEALKTVVPILTQDLWDGAKEHGLFGGVMVGIPSVLGAGVGTYYPTGDEFTPEERTKLIQEMPREGINRKRIEALRQASAQERRMFREAHPEIARKLDEQALEKRGATSRVAIGIKLERMEAEASLGAELKARIISAARFREYYSTLQTQYASRQDQANIDSGLYQGGERPSDPLRQAVYDYYQVYKAAQRLGRLDYDQVDAELAKLQEQWTPEQRQYVEENTGQQEHQSPVIRQFVADKQAITAKGWWQVYDDIQAKYPAIKQLLKSTNPQYRLKAERALSEQASVIHEQMRFADPELEMMLLKWGYVQRPINPAILARGGR